MDWLPPEIRDSAVERRLANGDTLFRQGDPAAAIFKVVTGRIRLVRHGKDSHAVTLHTARAGEFFAEAALFAPHYHCDAMAVAPAVLRGYSKRKLLQAFRADNELALRFMAVLARQIHALRARLEERNIRSARERVLHHLALSAGSDGHTVDMGGTVMELAVELGLTHEALYRTLAVLERDGSIERQKNRVILRRSSAV